MNGFYDFFYFSNERKSLASQGIINKQAASRNIFFRLLDLVAGRFRYTLPDTMDARYLEAVLINNGVCGVIDYYGEIVNLEITSGNNFSRYGYFNNVQLSDYMAKYYGSYIPDTPGNVSPDCVLIYDSLNQNLPPVFRIKWYADRLTTLQGSINSCIVNMRGSTVIQCTKEQEPVIKKAYKAADDGVPVIISFKREEGAFSEKPLIITNPQSSDLLRELQECYDKTLAEFFTEFGINGNDKINKLSGISDKELQQNEQATKIALKNAFDARKKGIEKVRKMFNLTSDECNVEISFDNSAEEGENANERA